MPHGPGELAAAVAQISAAWRADRKERQARRHLERADFDALRDAGLLLAPVPTELGGMWEGAPSSARWIAEIFRALGSADPSVALVSSMHPSVLAFWLSTA